MVKKVKSGKVLSGKMFKGIVLAILMVVLFSTPVLAKPVVIKVWTSTLNPDIISGIDGITYRYGSVDILLDGVCIGEISADCAGNWKYPAYRQRLTEGKHTIQAIDMKKNESSDIFEFTIKK